MWPSASFTGNGIMAVLLCVCLLTGPSVTRILADVLGEGKPCRHHDEEEPCDERREGPDLRPGRRSARHPREAPGGGVRAAPGQGVVGHAHGNNEGELAQMATGCDALMGTSIRNAPI